MRQKKFWYVMSGILAVLAMALMLPTRAEAASKYKVLHKFTGGRDGGGARAGVIFDQAGNLYGTTQDGGTSDAGIVFELTPNSDGSWTESVLYNFTGGLDGGIPDAGLIFDQAGNLYGTTYYGGSGPNGTAFRLTPNSDGTWNVADEANLLRVLRPYVSA